MELLGSRLVGGVSGGAAPLFERFFCHYCFLLLLLFLILWLLSLGSVGRFPLSFGSCNVAVVAILPSRCRRDADGSCAFVQ